MKILAVCQYYRPEQFHVTDVCEALRQAGHEVTVLTGLPNYPVGTVPEEYRRGKRRVETLDGVRVFRAYERGRGHGAFSLLLNYVTFAVSSAIKAVRLSKTTEADVIFCYQLSPVFMIWPAAILKKRLKKPLLVYALDLWPESMTAILKNKKNPLFRLTGAISKRLYRAADRILVPSEAFPAYFERAHGIPEAKIGYLPQFGQDSLTELSLEKKERTPVRFVMTGNLGAAQNLSVLLEAAKRLNERELPAWEIHLVGGGSLLEETRTAAAGAGLSERVIFHGKQPEERMGEFYRMADACLLTLSGGSIIGQTVPARLQGYLAAGKAVLAAIGDPAAALINGEDLGQAVPPDDAEALAEILGQAVLHPEGLRSQGERARSYYLAHYTKRAHMDRLIREMKLLSEAD